ncbi:hypothetical protein [Mucilaginibacter sp.]|uniref:hypothetical protein n=1 Tax=Mucilaginibacter sp. TaxID=1882438 RepID=UPI003D0B1C18
MEKISISNILSVIIGGLLTFLASYFLESKKLKNEKYKFTREKIISVGEDFYRFSAYALLRFETLLDTYENMFNYDSQEAANVMCQVDDNLKLLLSKIAENNITITSADIFYGVSGADTAALFINEIKTAEAQFQEVASGNPSNEELINALTEIKKTITKYIDLIKKDRETVKKKIIQILKVS